VADKYADKAPPRPRQCRRSDGVLKQQFDSLTAAQEYATRIGEERGVTLNAYRCEVCRRFHVGKPRRQSG
jgi:hypothetical protein